MYPIFLAFHIVVCLLVILVVLIQSGKGAGLNTVFGGGGGDALFSAPSGSMFIRKLTTALAIGFFMTSLFLTFLSARRGFRTVTRYTPPPAAAPDAASVPGTIPGVAADPKSQPNAPAAPSIPPPPAAAKKPATTKK